MSMEVFNMAEFNRVHHRKATHSLKWDNVQSVFHTDDILPMWVADMDFKAPQAVNEALKQRAEHGIYGYTVIDDSIRTNVTKWIEQQHHWQIAVNDLVFSPGVITSLYAAIHTFTNPGDRILLQTPVYTPFFHLIEKSQREIVENELVYNGQSYEIDFNHLETQLKRGVKAMMLCSPHNPVGRVWTKEELTKVAELCLQYDVLILSDEIHADLTFKGHTHTPIASLSERISEQTITFMSPTKTFNLAGLQASYMVIQDTKKKIALQNELGQQGFNMLNTMGVLALDAAYQSGLPWLEELLDVIEANKNYAIQRLENETNHSITIIRSEGTYLLWMDCHNLSLTDQELQQFMIETAKVGLNAGSSYGNAGKQFMRMNIACPHSTLEEGIDRIVHAINNL